MEAYRLYDEPIAGPLARFAVNPVWPLFLLMFAGIVPAMAWYAFNGFALGTPRRVQDAAIAVGGVVIHGAVMMGLVAWVTFDDVPDTWMPYLRIVATVTKLAFGYVLFARQAGPHALHEYYEGPTKNAMVVVFLVAFALQWVRGSLPPLVTLLVL